MILQNKVALVTGGTTGIGRATATLAVSAKQRARCCWSKSRVLR